MPLPLSSVSILGRRYRFRLVPNLAARGDCDPPDKRGKQIRVWSGTKDQERLEVLIHELLHAANWSLAEEHVAQFAADTAAILWRLGYRQCE